MVGFIVIGELNMNKYASMWKADTPVERQADARELWSDLTGVNHAKKDTSTRLQEMFPAASTHNKEASKSSIIRDRLLGSAIATGALGGGLYQHNRSKRNNKGFSKRDMERMSRGAAYQTSLEMGGSAKSKASTKMDRTRGKIEKYMDENPGQATTIGALLGGTAAGVGAHRALKRLARKGRAV